MTLRNVLRATPMVALFSACTLIAQAAYATSLVEAIGMARKNDPVYRGALGDYVAGLAAREQGKAGLRPQIAFSATQGRAQIEREFLGRAATPSVQEDLSTYNRTIQLRQTLFNLDAKTRAELGDKRADLADTALNAQLGALVNRIMKAYLEAIGAAQELDLAKAALEQARAQRSIVQSQLSAGEATRVELEEAQAREDIAVAAENQARNTHDLSLRLLSGFTGETITTVDRLRTDLIIPIVDEAQFEAWRDSLLDTNPDVLGARKAAELQELELERRKAADMPRLDFVLLRSQLQSDSINISNQRIDQTAANLQLQVPLYTGGAYRADIEQQEGIVAKAQADANETARRQVGELRRAWSVLSNGPLRLGALERAVKAAELLVKSAQTGVLNKVKVMADVLEARRQLTQTQRDLGKARMEIIEAQLQALILSGALTEENLTSVEKFFISN